MDDYDTMVHTARPFVETIIRQAQDLHRKKKKELEKSWSLIDDELRSVENGDHEVLHVLQDAHDKVRRGFTIVCCSATYTPTTCAHVCPPCTSPQRSGH